MDKDFCTRVIGGKFKGKKLLIPRSSITRSSKAILRESCFNSLGKDINDSFFIEAFGGSGCVGIEALSRGACFGYFIEENKEIYKLLNKNISSLGIKNYELILGDTFLVLADLMNKLRDKKVFLYLDPPFNIRKNKENIYEDIKNLIKNIDAFIIIIEHFTFYSFGEFIGGFYNFKKKIFGKSTLSYYIKECNLL